jgi:hypothetical protein
MEKVQWTLKELMIAVLAFMFSGAFIALVILAFFKYGNAEMAFGLVTGLVGIVGSIATMFFVTKGQAKGP